MPLISSLTARPLSVSAPDQSKESLIRRRYFLTGSGFGYQQNTVYAVALQPDGKILVGGQFTSYNGNTRNRLVRLMSNGQEDTAFGANLGTGFNGAVISISTQPDGKILVGGSFTTFNGNSRNRLVRLNSDGTEDTDFSSLFSNGFNGYVAKTLLLPDGRIFVCGSFNLLNSRSYLGLVMLDADARPDRDFTENTRPNAVVLDLALQSDGKILVGGAFSSVFDSNGFARSRNRILRLNSNGTEDTAFYNNIGTGLDTDADDRLYRIRILSSGKIMLLGSFNAVNGTTRNGIARLNSNGSLDTSWNPGTGFNQVAYDLVEQPDGKMVVVGQFTQYQGESVNGILRLNEDGTVDTSFAIGTGLEGSPFTTYGYSVAIDSENRFIVGGDFTTFNGENRVGLVKLDSRAVPARTGFPSAA